MGADSRFRFDPTLHEYVDLERGDVLPHITGLLGRAGWVDDRFYTDESSDRGTQVHDLTAAYDLDALDVEACVSPFRAYLLAHVEAVGIVRPQWTAVEIPRVHPTFKFGGRPDRAGIIYRAKAVLEIKTGPPERAHEVQTALQAILEAPEFGIPAEAVVRYALHLTPKAKWKLLLHGNPNDYIEAYRILRKYACL